MLRDPKLSVPLHLTKFFEDTLSSTIMPRISYYRTVSNNKFGQKA